MLVSKKKLTSFSNVMMFVTFICGIIQTGACIIGLFWGYTENAGKFYVSQNPDKAAVQSSNTVEYICEPPYSRFVKYLAPGFELGCWMSKTGE
jgi:hypothetical protein